MDLPFWMVVVAAVALALIVECALWMRDRDPGGYLYTRHGSPVGVDQHRESRRASLRQLGQDTDADAVVIRARRASVGAA